jgi:hypothetical protein
MRIQQLLEHHGIVTNPFAEEDAQTDPVFKDRCRDGTHHPVWDKVYGDPTDPATSIVFGEKGAGKTAMRMQISGRIADHNAQHKDGRIYIIEYDNFNPFLDGFADRFSARKQRDPARILADWKLWDHMDAILSLGVTDLTDRLLDVAKPSGPPANRLPAKRGHSLDRQQKRDVLLLAACYDNSTSETSAIRWNRLKRKLHFRTWFSRWDLLLGYVVTIAVVAAVGYSIANSKDWLRLTQVWPYLFVALGWAPWLARVWKWHFEARRIVRNIRVLNHDKRSIRRALMRFYTNDIQGQPLPARQRTDDRYELLAKFQGVLQSLGYSGVVVLVDRVDEPHLITGSVERMKALIWPMLDNKFLKQPGIGLKLLLPSELNEFLERESRDFYQRARLDKQNMIPSLDWTGHALYDLANTRVKCCAAGGQKPSLRSLINKSVDDQRLIDAFASLRTPRHLFKFMYRLLVAHCNAYTDDQPVWEVPQNLFEATLSVYRRDQDAVDRGLRAG